ncbi:MAG TPA: class I SAM-dependent methyltransferase [Anaerolineales bacterium]|nr:class I SAM-dependent methyltransferase [Anaerolineales bacterium]
MEHNKVIRKAFSKQAASFGDTGLTLSNQDILDWIVDLLPLDKQFRVLEVAAGTGHLSLAIAPHVREVVAIDITTEMLEQARAEARRRKLDNLSFEEENAEKLPYQKDHFDLVVSRLAIHHFKKPIIQLREMVRVCKPNHRIGVIDLLSPEDKRIAKTYNHLERLRDPSHTVALSKKQMTNILGEVGIVVEKIEVRDIEVDFQRWVKMTGTKSRTAEILKEELMRDIGGSKTGMRPFMKNSQLKFLQVWSVIYGTKISKPGRT